MNGYSNLGTSRISHGRDSYVTQKKHISVRHVAIDVYTYIYIYHIYIYIKCIYSRYVVR